MNEDFDKFEQEIYRRLTKFVAVIGFLVGMGLVFIAYSEPNKPIIADVEVKVKGLVCSICGYGLVKLFRKDIVVVDVVIDIQKNLLLLDFLESDDGVVHYMLQGDSLDLNYEKGIIDILTYNSIEDDSYSSKTISVDIDTLIKVPVGIYFPKAYVYAGSDVDGAIIDTTLYNNYTVASGEIDIVDVSSGGTQNSPPSIVISNLTIKDNRTTSVPVLVRDLDGDSVTVAIKMESDSLTAALNTTMDTLTIIPTAGYLGTSRITFTLSDSTYSNITKNIFVTVTHVNGAPVITSNYLANVSLLEDGSFVGVVKAVEQAAEELRAAKEGAKND